MRLGLKPQKRRFFELFTDAASNIVEITRLLAELLAQYPEDSRELIAKIKEREHDGDQLTTELVGLVNRTFVTPFDRDDIFRLATALDDICDHVDDAAANLELYDVRRVPERARVYTTLGNAAYSRGELEAADAHFRTALAIRREALGPDHPEVASSLVRARSSARR